MSNNWLTVTKATITQSQLMLVTKAIPETQVPKAGANSLPKSNFYKIMLRVKWKLKQRMKLI